MKSETTTFYRYFPISHRDKSWGLYATTAGESHIAPRSPYPPSGHPKNYAAEWQKGRVLDEFQFVYISSGAGNFESESGPSIRIEPGHAFLLFPGIWHRYSPDSEIGWGEHWIGFNGETARHWRRCRFISAKNPILKISAHDATLMTFSRIMQFVRSNCPALQQILAGAATYMVGLFYSAQQTQSAADAQSPNAIELAIARINSEFAQNLDMKSLAEKVGLSYSSFRSTFAAHTGLSPHKYLLELRLIQARKLLVETNLSIKEIALQTGFEDEHYFSRLFHQKINVTAGQFRSRSQRHR
ncbi:MAG TPA: helix-turn-helix domain-containing protein [Candidatus Sulfotelmatobacter sp.]|nr:helix-turn-helix domain-containing protein [Candidatus Sulfotelmatobacter sp.]